MDQVICYPVCCHYRGRDEKTTDKVCRNATAGKREGMPTEQLLQMPAVCTDRFSITGFATYSTQWTEIKNYKKTVQTQGVSTGAPTPYTIHYTQFSCLPNTFCCSATFTIFNKITIVLLLFRIYLYNPLVLVGLLELMIIQWEKLC